MSRPPVVPKGFKQRAPRKWAPEVLVERECVKLFRLHGGKVKKLSQGFRGHRDSDGKWKGDRGGTRQTPGIADLEIFFPAHRLLLKFEVKTPDGEKLHQRMLAKRPEEVKAYMVDDYRRAIAQHEYEEDCRACGIPYGRGGVADALLTLQQLGIARG